MLRSLQWHAQLIANSILYHIEHLSKVRFRNKSLWNAGLAEILKKNKMTNDSHVIHS